MKVLLWLQALVVVYLRRLAALSVRAKTQIVLVLAALLISAWIGLAATLILLIAGGLVLPLLNPDVKAEIDQEYDSAKH